MKPLLCTRARKHQGTPRYVFLLVSFVITALLVSTSAYAQDKTSEIDEIFAWTTPETPGCAVAVSQHRQVIVNRTYGLAHLETKVLLEQQLRAA